MPTNIYDQAFGEGVNLTAAIIDLALPNYPIIEKLLSKVVDETGMETTEGFVEREGETVRLVPTAPRGGTGQAVGPAARDGVRVSAVHIPHVGSVLADQAQNMRAMGQTTLETPENIRIKTLLAMKKNLVYTKAFHLLGAVKGQVLDTDGTVLLDSFALWGGAQQAVNFALDVSTTNLTTQGIAVQRKSEDALGGTTPEGYVGIASPSFMDKLRAHAYFERVLQFAAPSDLLSDYRTGIVVGDTTFVEMRAPAGWPVSIETDTAYVVPLGVAGLIVRRYAPADWNETVNTLGLPYYAKSEPMPMGRGYTIETQTNPFTLCTRPRSIIKVTASE